MEAHKTKKLAERAEREAALAARMAELRPPLEEQYRADPRGCLEKLKVPELRALARHSGRVAGAVSRAKKADLVSILLAGLTPPEFANWSLDLWRKREDDRRGFID